MMNQVIISPPKSKPMQSTINKCHLLETEYSTNGRQCSSYHSPFAGGECINLDLGSIPSKVIGNGIGKINHPHHFIVIGFGIESKPNRRNDPAVCFVSKIGIRKFNKLSNTRVPQEKMVNFVYHQIIGKTDQAVTSTDYTECIIVNSMEREIKPGVFSEIIVVVVMQSVDFFAVLAEPEEEVVVIVVVDGVVEMGGNEGGVLD